MNKESQNAPDIDLDALEQKALAATPGPWEVVYRDDDHCMTMTVIAPKGSMGDSSNVMRLSDDPNQANVIAITWHQLTPWAGQESFNNDQSDANDSFIAAANPAVILELISRLREAESDALEEILEPTESQLEAMCEEYEKCDKEQIANWLHIKPMYQAAIRALKDAK
jgi:hypothetical protein